MLAYIHRASLHLIANRLVLNAVRHLVGTDRARTLTDEDDISRWSTSGY